MNIRKLLEEDWQDWKSIRLESLKNSPESYTASFEEESMWIDQNFMMGLMQDDIFGAFDEDKIVGCAAFSAWGPAKTIHKGALWGLYVQPKYRRKGIGSNLIDTIIQHAKPHVLQLNLCCTTNNKEALKLYQSKGFKIYGTEPRAIKVEDVYFDEHLMTLGFIHTITEK